MITERDPRIFFRAPRVSKRTDHSYRSASNGSTFAARRVGAQQAASATPANSNPTPINVTGSVGSTSNRNDFSTRDNTIAATMPDTTPPAISRNPSPNIRFRMSLCRAPTAVRIAISRRRAATESDSTP